MRISAGFDARVTARARKANDETNEMEIITNEKEISRQMDSKTRSERSVLRNVFVIICLFIPFLMITVLKNAVVYLKQKVYDFVQSKLKKFNEIHGDNKTLQQQTDPVFTAYIKYEDQVPGKGYRQKTTKTAEDRRVQKTAQQTNKRTYKIKKNKSTGKKRNQRKIKIQPPPVEELVLKGPIDTARTPDSPSPTSTFDVPGQVPANINVQTTLAGDRNMCCCKHASASKESKRRSGFYFHFCRIVNAMVDALLFMPRIVYAYVQRELEQFNDIHQDSMEVLPYTEPAFIAYLKGEEAAPFIESPHIRFSSSGSKDLPCSPLPSSSGLEKEQSSALPTVVQQAQAKSELTIRWKTNGPHSTTLSKNDFATRVPGTEKKAKPKVKSRLISSAHTDVFAPTPALEEKTKGKDIPSPSRYVHHEIRAPGKVKDQEHSSSGVTHSSQVRSTNVTGDSQGIASRETDGKSSPKGQVLVEPTTPTVKQAKNEEEFEQISCWDDHASIDRTQNMSQVARDVSLNVAIEVASNITGKRNTERSIYVNSKAAPTEFVGRQAHRDVRQPEEAIAKEPQLIEVVKSALSVERLSTGHPEVMETDGEQCAVTISSGEPAEAKQQSEIANASFIELMGPMELDQEQCQNEILSGDVQTEAMETNHESASVDDSSFGVWANFVSQPSLAPPTEEMMETDQEPLLTTPSNAHQLETMETTHKLANACTPEAIPVEERDAKRPSSSTMGMLQEKHMLMKTPIADQGLTQSVMKPVTACMAPETEQCCMQRGASIYNDLPQEMECEPLDTNQCFGIIKQQMSAVAETDHSKSTNQPTMEQQQLEPEVSYFSDDLDSDSQADGYCDLGLGGQVLLIIDLLA